MSKDGVPFCFITINLMDGSTVGQSPYRNRTSVIPELASGNAIFSFSLNWNEVHSLTCKSSWAITLSFLPLRIWFFFPFVPKESLNPVTEFFFIEVKFLVDPGRPFFSHMLTLTYSASLGSVIWLKPSARNFCTLHVLSSHILLQHKSRILMPNTPCQEIQQPDLRGTLYLCQTSWTWQRTLLCQECCSA